MRSILTLNAIPVRLIVVLVMLLSLMSCGDSETLTEEDQATNFKMPTAMASLTLPAGTLRAWVSVDAGSRQEMMINSTANTASVDISGLDLAVHTILIEYEFTDAAGTITLASAQKLVDLSSGSGTLQFQQADYDLDSYDDDNDGISNAAELGLGVDPRDSVCVADVSTLGLCTAG